MDEWREWNGILSVAISLENWKELVKKGVH